MGKKDPRCPYCHEYIKSFNHKVQEHKLPIVLSSGKQTKIRCPGVGKDVVYY